MKNNINANIIKNIEKKKNMIKYIYSYQANSFPASK